jgi:hypothetical protein
MVFTWGAKVAEIATVDIFTGNIRPFKWVGFVARWIMARGFITQAEFAAPYG